MESAVEPSQEPKGERRRVRRKHRSFLKSRQFWIALFAIGVAILMVLWLISTLGAHRGEVD
jgi:hypothetical protein